MVFKICLSGRRRVLEQSKEIGVTTFVPVQDRDERTLLRELTHRIQKEFISSINVVFAAAVRTENPEVKVALSHVVELLEHHADINRILAIPVCTENFIRVDDVMESPKLAE
jgi:hypothetical protein